MTTLQPKITALERKRSTKRGSKWTDTEIDCRRKSPENMCPSSSSSQLNQARVKPPISRGFQTVYLTENDSGGGKRLLSQHAIQQRPPARSCMSPRALHASAELPNRRTARTLSLGTMTRLTEDFGALHTDHAKSITKTPQRQLPRRTRSCMSSRSLRAAVEGQPVRKTKRTVSFGTVEGVTVKNIALENKSTLWFSRDEYSAMRLEAIQIASALQKSGSVEESSLLSTRGLEKLMGNSSAAQEFAKKSVLEHHDLAMYSLASSRAVHTARRIAEMDALEAFSSGQEIFMTQHAYPRSRRKVMNP